MTTCTSSGCNAPEGECLGVCMETQKYVPMRVLGGAWTVGILTIGMDRTMRRVDGYSDDMTLETARGIAERLKRNGECNA